MQYMFYKNVLLRATRKSEDQLRLNVTHFILKDVFAMPGRVKHFF